MDLVKAARGLGIWVEPASNPVPATEQRQKADLAPEGQAATPPQKRRGRPPKARPGNSAPLSGIDGAK